MRLFDKRMFLGLKIFKSYLKQRWRGIGAGFLFCLIFLLTFLLYHLPVEAVLYPAGLCALLGMIFLAWDFRRVCRKHDRLQQIRSLMDAAEETFVPVESVEDEDYQQIIRLIRKEQMRQQVNMDLRYEEMLDYYTIWAHQIKTPIASMRLHLQNEDSSLSRQLSADLFRIEQYVEMVLMFLRLDSESTDYVIREYDLDGIVRGAVKKFAGEFISRKIRLEYMLLNTKVITDEKWLSFVVEQVLSNALKYTQGGIREDGSQGSIHITLEAPKTLCIRDNGIGIAPEDLPRIFEKGYTGYNGRSDKKASGIGLYLCRRICQNLKHPITAESIVDQGTVIRIDLERQGLEVE